MDKDRKITEKIEGNTGVAIYEVKVRINTNDYYWHVWIAFDVYSKVRSSISIRKGKKVQRVW